MKSSPGFTQAIIGMSGCQRLWIAGFLYGDCDKSIFISVFDMTNSFCPCGPTQGFSYLRRAPRLPDVTDFSDREELRDRRFVDVIAGIGVDDAAVFHHQDAIGDVEDEAQHLLADHDA